MLALALAVSSGCGRATTPTAPAEDAARSQYPLATVPGSFVPPDAEQRRAAVGSLEGLRGPARRAFEEGDGMFDPVPRPAAGDWLDERAERFQTFDRYRDRRKTHPDATRKTIALLEIGAFGEGSPSVAALTRYVEAYYGMPVRRMTPVTLEELDVEQRVHDGRLQLQAKQILKRLYERKPDDAFALAAITMTDLYPDEEWNFVFGYARAADQVGVFSFHRFDPQTGREAVLRRSANTLVHELGHMFGVSHCTLPLRDERAQPRAGGGGAADASVSGGLAQAPAQRGVRPDRALPGAGGARPRIGLRGRGAVDRTTSVVHRGAAVEAVGARRDACASSRVEMRDNEGAPMR